MAIMKLPIEQVLENNELINYFISFNRNEDNKQTLLFEEFKKIDKSELNELIEDGEFMDYHPFFTQIGSGEYGNCILTLYREKFYDFYLKNPSLYADDENEEGYAEYMNDLINSRLDVYGCYAYQYKGIMEEFWFIGKLKEVIVLEVK